MDSYYYCECGFKCVEGQLSKSKGACPKCGSIRADMAEKHKFTKKGVN